MATSLTGRVGVSLKAGRFSMKLAKSRKQPVASLYSGVNAHMTAVFGEKYPYAEPYDYKKKPLTGITEWFDYTTPRLCENSKYIIVEGNLATGKHAVAHNICKNFDLQMYPACTNDDLYRSRSNGFNYRDLNPMLPARSRYYDLENWLKETDLTRGKVGAAQLEMYKAKFLRACEALLHLLSTGQGSVQVRSPWSDMGFTYALKRMNQVTTQFYGVYKDWYDNSVCDILKPHVCVYVDLPVSEIMDRIKKRNDPLEMKTKVPLEELVHKLDDYYKNKFIPDMSKNVEVLIVDGRDLVTEGDHDALADEIQELNLESFDYDDQKFKDWYRKKEDDFAMYRKQYAYNSLFISYALDRNIAYKAPEILSHPDDKYIMKKIVYDHPAIKYQVGTSYELNNPVKAALSMW